MAGWGLVGLGGRRRSPCSPGAASAGLGLAVACGLAGLAYGALLDLSVMVTYGGEQSLDRYLALSARGIPFNVAHAVGNIALALAAGPALVRMISRYRSRFEFTWRPPAARPRGARPRLRSRGGAGPVRARRARRQPPRPGTGSSGRRTPTAASAPPRAAPRARRSRAGRRWGWRRPAATRSTSTRRARADRLPARPGRRDLRSTGDLERTDPRARGRGRRTRAASAAATWSPSFAGDASGDGSFEGQVNLTAFGVLALRAAGAAASALARSAAWLREAQNGDGGWGFQPGPAATRTAPAPRCRPSRRPGRRQRDRDGRPYLRRASAPTAASRWRRPASTNSQSTAWAVQGLIAAGANPARSHGGTRPSTISPPPGRRRPLPLLVGERPDTGLGHRARRCSRSTARRSRWPPCRGPRAIADRSREAERQRRRAAPAPSRVGPRRSRRAGRARPGRQRRGRAPRAAAGAALGGAAGAASAALAARSRPREPAPPDGRLPRAAAAEPPPPTSAPASALLTAALAAGSSGTGRRFPG